MRAAARRLLAVALISALPACTPTRTASEAETLVVVVPSRHDGHVGAVVVNQGDHREVLDSAYAAARTRPRDAVRRTALSAEDVGRIFGAASAALPPRATSYTLYFALGTQTLTAESQRILEEVLGDVARRAAAEVIVTGHTDRIGTDERNRRLSLQRAQHMRTLVIGRGVQEAIVHAEGLGESEPLIATADGVAEPRNRRVEITVR